MSILCRDEFINVKQSVSESFRIERSTVDAGLLIHGHINANQGQSPQHQPQYRVLLLFGLCGFFTHNYCFMVPRAGFEPATLTLEPSCSNPLSYRGITEVF